MKKLFLVGALALFGAMNAQTKFGVNAGYLSLNAKVKILGQTGTASDSGYYLGVFGEFGKDKVKFQPGLNIAGNGDGTSMYIPLTTKFYVADKFNLQLSPQFLFDFNEAPAGYNNLNLGLGFGAGYDISDKFMAEARYSLQLNNHFENSSSDFSAKVNYLNIGLGYKF